MSSIKRSILTAALVGAMGVSANAFAVTVTIGTDTVPFNAFNTSSSTVATDENLVVVADSGDAYLGRTQGYNVRLEIGDGNAATSGDGVFDQAIGNAAPAGDTGASVVKAGGGNPGDASVTYGVTPSRPGGVIAGDGITIPTFVLRDMLNLATIGNQHTVTIKVQDPGTGVELARRTVTLYRSADGWVTTFTPSNITSQRIDVGSPSFKRFFTRVGTLGTGSAGETFHAGTVLPQINPALDRALGLDPAVATSQVVVTGTDFSAFRTISGNGRVYLATSDQCPTAGSVPMTIAADGKSASTATSVTVQTVQNTRNVCFAPNQVDEIVEQPVGARVPLIAQTGYRSSGPYSGDLFGMRYNGSVVQVFNVNPAGNTTQQSFLRIINRSNVGGLVTITAIDDAGNAAAAPVQFQLGARSSLQVNSSDLENGNAAKGVSGGWGTGTGKWRATVTGEFGSMVVQSLNRNNNTGTLTNITDADTRGEQFLDEVFDNQ
jgi:hypothetical protein